MSGIDQINEFNKEVEKAKTDGFTLDELKTLSTILDKSENKIIRFNEKLNKETIIDSVADKIILAFLELNDSEASINWNNAGIQIDMPGPNMDIDIEEGEAKYLNKLEDIGIEPKDIIDKVNEKRPDIKTYNNFIEEIIDSFQKTNK